jgi:hypothetical protein
VGDAIIAPDPCCTNRLSDDQGTRFSAGQRAKRSAYGAG